MSYRQAEKAGTWYPASPIVLQELLDKCLQCADGATCDGTPVAAITPHAGLAFSGPCAAKAFALLKNAEADTVVVLGAVHTMHLQKPAIWSSGEWETPLGAIPVDKALAGELLGTGAFIDSENPHFGDNSIELQTPFIKYCFPEANILPVAVPPLPGVGNIGKIIADAARSAQRKVVVVGSSDFTHYGDSFGWTPAGTGTDALKWATERDRELIDLALSLDYGNIVEKAARDHSACGSGAIAATTAYAAALNAHGKLLEQTNSHEIMPDGEARHFVGYASIVFSV